MSRKTKDWIEAYDEYTESWEPPKIFNKWVGLATISIALQRRVWLEEANSKIYPNLYIVLAAPSGVGKTTAMREAIPFIEPLGVKVSPAKITAAQLAVDIEGAVKDDEDLGIYTPYLIWAEELPSWLGPDAYKSGMLADLTALYDCPKEWEKQTKTRKTQTIAAPYVCLLGGTTPQGIFDVLPPGVVGQGLTSRILFVYADYNDKRVVEKAWGEKQELLKQALWMDIQTIASLKGGMKLSDVARALWADYYLNRPRPEEEFNDYRLQAYASRKPFIAKKLAVLYSVSESDELMVEAHHLEKAMIALQELDPGQKQVYGEIAPSVPVNHYPKILRVLDKAKGKIMSHSELLRRFSYTMDITQFKLAIDGLAQQGLIERELVSMGGARTKLYYRIPKGEK